MIFAMPMPDSAFSKVLSAKSCSDGPGVIHPMDQGAWMSLPAAN
jgi:hypothetical protein